MATAHIDLGGVQYTLTGDLTRNEAADLETLSQLIVHVGEVETIRDPVRKRYTVRMTADGYQPLVFADGLSKGQAQQLEDALDELFRVQGDGVHIETD
jgi:hypothetical protein